MACDESLYKKLFERSGKLQLTVQTLVELARRFEANPTEVGIEKLISSIENLLIDVSESASWWAETSDLLKQLYNRSRGPP